MSLIKIENLNFSYKTADGQRLPVLSNINLSIEQGELIAIQGPSGSGKSTLLYVIGCLLNDFEGKVFVDGQDISKLSEEKLAFLRNQTFGFVFQQFHLMPKATVLENVLLPSQYSEGLDAIEDQAKERALELISNLGLSDKINVYPNQLSGGQQQRVSMARALINNTQIILADEPTGSLDTENSNHIMELLKAAHLSGRTVIIITHDSEVARHCDRVIHFCDGTITNIFQNTLDDEGVTPSNLFSTPFRLQGSAVLDQKKSASIFEPIASYLKMGIRLFPLCFQNMQQHRSRSMLTMLGIVIGVAAILSMLTIGSFTKRKILESYADLGVNTLVFYGWPNWDLKATDQFSLVFQKFDWDKDVAPLSKIFPELMRASPRLHSFGNSVSFGGKSIDSDVRLIGINENGLGLLRRNILMGNNFSPYHVADRSPVCVIGFEIFQRLFSNISPIGQIIYMSENNTSFSCRIIGVLEPYKSSTDSNKPDLNVFIPFSLFQGIGSWWNSQMHEVLLEVWPRTDTEVFARTLKAFFNVKYGHSGRFDASKNSVLVAQMNKFLTLFTILLGFIACVSLAVGGIGITNMMLVSVAERFKEIGIRKAFGATNFSIRVQYLVESILVCTIAGSIGLVAGFVIYELAIYGASQFVDKLEFEWVVDYPALFFSIVSSLVVGVMSGLTPAFKAEKLQVIEALRSE